MNNNEIATHDLTHSMDTPLCFLCQQRCKDGHPLQGHLIRIGGMDDQFRLYYAGWDDQWLIRTLAGEDMCRAGVEELPPFLIHETPICECYLDCEADSHSGDWHTHEDEPCPVHPQATMVG